jgi:HK97 gp10 family phage protein
VPADFSEVDKLAADLAVAGPRQVLFATKALQKTAHDVEATGKQLAAVDTGDMRDSIGIDWDLPKLEAVIGPTVDYAPYVEFGTSKQAPQPFMEPALKRHEQGYYSAMERVAGGML